MTKPSQQYPLSDKTIDKIRAKISTRIHAITPRASMVAALTIGMMLLGFSESSTAVEATQPEYREIVLIVSGGAAVSPFTTPTQACETGWAAGSTDTYLRNYLLDKRRNVFTSPAMINGGRVPRTADDNAGPFGNCPAPLPVAMTVNSTGKIQKAGEHLANFVRYLVATYKVKQIHFVAHSMGGLFSRAAIGQLQKSNPTLKISSLTTLATPWNGVSFANYGCDEIDDQFCTSLKSEFTSLDILNELKREQISQLNKQNAGVLEHIPVTLIGADAFKTSIKPDTIPAKKENADIWPNDGVVNLSSMLAQNLPDDVINHRRCHISQGKTHSIWVSSHAQPRMDESTAITWNPEVADWVNQAIKSAKENQPLPARQGCP